MLMPADIPNRRREDNSLRSVGVMGPGYGDNNPMFRIDHANISCRPAGTGEDKRKGVEGEDLTVVKQFNVRHAGDESGHVALSSGQDCMFRKESSYNDSEHKNIMKWNNKVDVDAKACHGYSVHEGPEESKPKVDLGAHFTHIVQDTSMRELSDMSRSADFPKSSDKQPASDMIKTADEISIHDKAKTADEISIPDKAKTADKISIPDKAKTADKISIPDKAKTADEFSIPDKAKTADEISIPDKAKPADEISIPDKAKTADEISIPDKAKTADEFSMPDKAKTADEISIPDKAKTADEISIPDKAKTADEISIPDKAKTADKISIPDKAKTADETSFPDKAKTADEFSMPDKAKTADQDPIDKEKTNFGTKANSAQTGVQAGGYRDNKLGLKVNGTDKICQDPVKSFKCCRDVALRSGTFSLPQVLIACTMIISVFHCGAATHLKQPGQEFPGKCFSMMDSDGNDCPQYDDPSFESRYTSLNETCCAGYPYLDFHCQMDYQTSGEQFSMITCLRTVEVPEGHSGKIMGYDTSDPYFKVEKLDDAQARKPASARESWQVTNSYHPHAKIRCEGLGQQLLCLGIEDNLCTCQVEFYPNGKGCESGFDAEDACVCQHLDCPVGTLAARNFSKQIGGSCGDLLPGFTAEFFCKENPTPASTIPSTTPSTFAGSSTTSHPPNTTRAIGDDDGKKDSKTTMIASLVVSLLIVLVLVVLVINYRAKLKAKLSSVCRRRNVWLKKSYGQGSDDSLGSVSLASASASSGSVV